MQMAHRLIMLEIDVLILDTALEPFAEDAVERAADLRQLAKEYRSRDGIRFFHNQPF